MKKQKATGGAVAVGDKHWSWAEVDGHGEMWTGTDDVVHASDVLQAARSTRAAMSSDLVDPSMRVAPSTYAAIGEVLDLPAAIERYDAALIAALDVLRVENARALCDYGMPSEYRGWLQLARESAAAFLASSERDESDWPRRHLAEEIIMGCCAVAVSMRFGYATTPFTIAVAIAGLRDAIPA
jgi:hypothetical protein